MKTEVTLIIWIGLIVGRVMRLSKYQIVIFLFMLETSIAHARYDCASEFHNVTAKAKQSYEGTGYWIDAKFKIKNSCRTAISWTWYINCSGGKPWKQNGYTRRSETSDEYSYAGSSTGTNCKTSFSYTEKDSNISSGNTQNAPYKTARTKIEDIDMTDKKCGMGLRDTPCATSNWQNSQQSNYEFEQKLLADAKRISKPELRDFWALTSGVCYTTYRRTQNLANGVRPKTDGRYHTFMQQCMERNGHPHTRVESEYKKYYRITEENSNTGPQNSTASDRPSTGNRSIAYHNNGYELCVVEISNGMYNQCKKSVYLFVNNRRINIDAESDGPSGTFCAEKKAGRCVAYFK